MPDYNFKKIEKKWAGRWFEDKIYEPDLDKSARPFYNLMMFPYPSAEGLHVGNMYAFVGADIYGRKKRMEGFDVFEPIGLDGFGIHSENYALKIGRNPMKLSYETEKRFYQQLNLIGNGFSWNERVETYDPEYYKWTQWIFVQMFKKGLAYRKKAKVNWCLKCLTVLADEQILAGQCERCRTKVIKKELEQWFFKITDYARRLLDDLEKIDWSERVKIAQRNWIGKSEGAIIKFKIQNSKFEIPVFTTRADTLFGATYIVFSPEHELIMNNKLGIKNYEEIKKYIEKTKNKSEEERVAEGKEKTGVELRGIKAINPATKKEIPVWVSDYVLSGYGTGAIMAVPAHDRRDFEFAKKFNLPVSDAPLADKDEIIKKVGGRAHINYRLRDWLISRQRYWGPPIPMIHCEICGWQPVPEKDLPVLLPQIRKFQPTGTDKSPLAAVKEFIKTKCPKCGRQARRETDVSDTFLDSAWYFFRYIDCQNTKKIFDIRRAGRWLPVDMYIGGAEHAVLHLLYTRFLTKVFNDWGLIDFDEPFKKFRAHGLLIKNGSKMSKSRGNVVNPDYYIKKFGADVLRMYLMFLGPFEQGGDFRDESIAGIDRFLNRVWKLGKKIKIKNQKSKLEKLLNKSIEKVGKDIENLHYNTAVSQLMILLNEMEKSGATPKNVFETFLKILAPFAPHLAEELWEKMGNKTSVHLEKWPEYDPKMIKEKTFELVIQINGKVRAKVEAPTEAGEAELQELALNHPVIKEKLAVAAPKKIIVVPKKLVNIVI
jgi:leucyl-tRNA synthetase